MKKLVLAAALVALFAAPQSGEAVTGTLNVQGRIAPTLRITPVNTLDFGNLIIVDSTAAGSAVVNPDGTSTLTNVSQLGAAQAGSFDLRGRSGAAVTLNFPASLAMTCAVDTDATNDCVGGTNTVTVSGFTNDFAGSMPATPGLPTVTVNFGGSMAVAGDQNSGLYSGTIIVEATY